jgi:hypothetical protein
MKQIEGNINIQIVSSLPFGQASYRYFKMDMK